MATMYFPMKGLDKANPPSVQPQHTTPDCNNVRPLAGNRFQGGQRPGLKKAYGQQIGGAAKPIVWLGSVTTFDAPFLGSAYDSYSVAPDNAGINSTGASRWFAQTFTTTSAYYISAVKIYLYRVGDPGTVTVSIRATSGGCPTGDGTDLCSGTIDGSTLTTDTFGDLTTINFTTSPLLADSTLYAIVVRSSTGAPANYLGWGADSGDASYTDGEGCNSTDSGDSWTCPYMANWDFPFQTYGRDMPIQDRLYSKQLIAIGNAEVWRESSAGTMAEFADANGVFDTNKLLGAVEAYQKIFTVNGSTLKVLDFNNTKISTDDAGTNPCTRNMILTGSTSGTTMIVDYVDGVTDDATANVYGSKTNIGSFVSGETVTGTNSAGNAVSFDLNADEDNGPHIYDWTAFGNDTTTYGTMSSSASIVALYRGRLVTNDADRPHMWYMSKVQNPFNWLYDDDDPLTAIRGNDADIGEIGDIITAFIPIRDDLLVVGCANSIWAIIGDPASHGQIGNVTNDTGIWGSRAWCLDNKGSLYFLGNDGLYGATITGTVTAPEKISYSRLPTLMDDLDLDQSLHRVVLSYDSDNNGVLISKTLISDGTNTNYWYDLNANGFFPESYPAAQGIFSSCKYNATDRTYVKHLVGCNDGYIREFDSSTKSDIAADNSSVAIDAYFTLGPMSLGGTPAMEGSIGPIDVVLGGGGSAGSETDSDNAAYKIFVADTAAELIEKLVANGTPTYAGTITGPGRRRGSRRTQSARGVYGGLRIGNSIADEAFIFESLDLQPKPKGRSK